MGRANICFYTQSLPVVQYTYIVHTSIYSTVPQIKQRRGDSITRDASNKRYTSWSTKSSRNAIARAVGNASNSRGIRYRRETNSSRHKSQKSNSSKNKSGTGVFAKKGTRNIRNKQKKQQQDASNSRSVSN